MRTGIFIAQPRASAGRDYRDVPPIAAYDTWLNTLPPAAGRKFTGSQLRRMVRLKRAGDTYAEIGRCIGGSKVGVRDAYLSLPEALR